MPRKTNDCCYMQLWARLYLDLRAVEGTWNLTDLVFLIPLDLHKIPDVTAGNCSINFWRSLGEIFSNNSEMSTGPWNSWVLALSCDHRFLLFVSGWMLDTTSTGSDWLLDWLGTWVTSLSSVSVLDTPGSLREEYSGGVYWRMSVRWFTLEERLTVRVLVGCLTTSLIKLLLIPKLLRWSCDRLRRGARTSSVSSLDKTGNWRRMRSRWLKLDLRFTVHPLRGAVAVLCALSAAVELLRATRSSIESCLGHNMGNWRTTSRWST